MIIFNHQYLRILFRKRVLWHHIVIWMALLASLRAFASDPSRLDPSVQPLIQALDLDLNPAQEHYEGTARVQLEFAVATNGFRFHADQIDLGRVTLDGQELNLTAETAGIISARSSTVISPGIHSFEIAFTNDFNRDAMGLYKVVADGNPYLFTQMEGKEARRSFPCWDEPAFKIPWQISVTIPAELVAVGNMPVVRSTPVGNKKRLEFGRSPAMPSYLVALAVGKLESIDIPGQSVPGRIFTIAGRKHLAEVAAKEIPALVRNLERYFGIPYPYPKLDHVAAPGAIFGGMENAGMIIYKDAFFLFDHGGFNFEQNRLMIEIIAHEAAHMWFGDLVTMKWWDDLWLNESFAQWISNEIADRLYPELRFGVRSYRNTLVARMADARKSVKPIRRTFNGTGNFLEVADELSYNKGQALLRMVDSWLGEEKFRKALRRYFAENLWGNARAEDLWAALSKDGEEPLAEMLRRYVEQPGIPELTFTRLPHDRLEIRQQRYRTIVGKNVADQIWHVPVVLRYGDSAGEHTMRLLLTNEVGSFVVPGLEDADWVYPNAGESGYYSWVLPPDLAAALTDRTTGSLSTIERLGVLNAAESAVQSGALGADQWLSLLRGFANDSEPEVQEMVVSGIVSIYRIFSETEQNRQALAKELRNTLRPMLDRLGFEAKPGEEPHWDPLRADLVSALGIYGKDPDIMIFCRKAAETQLTDPRSVRGAVAEAALAVATWHGDAEWSDRVRQAFEAAVEPDLRARFLGCLVPFADPTLTRSGLDYLLSEVVKSAEILPALHAANQARSSVVLFQWVRDRYPALEKKLSKELLPFLPDVLTHGDEALLEAGRKFFLDPVRRSRLTEVQFTKAAEAVELRTALRARHGAGIAKVLAQRAEP